MAFEIYKANVQRLADSRRIVNPLREEDLAIAGFVFRTLDGHETQILGSDLNRASRLYFEDVCSFPSFRAIRIGYGECFIQNAMEYFGGCRKGNASAHRCCRVFQLRDHHLEVAYPEKE